MLYWEIIAVCSQINTKHLINTLCGQNVEFLNVKLAVHIMTTGLKVVHMLSSQQKPHVTQPDKHFCYPVPHCAIYLPQSQTLQHARLFFAVVSFWRGEIVPVRRSVKVYRGGRGIAPLILIHLGTRWWTFTFTRGPLCPQNGRLRNRISISDSNKICLSSPKRRHQLCSASADRLVIWRQSDGNVKLTALAEQCRG